MADSQQKEILSGLLAGVPIPLIPKPKETSDPVRVDKWRRDLIEYIRKLLSRFTASNIINTIIQNITNIQIINLGGALGFGFGPVKVEVYEDVLWVDQNSAFNGRLVATGRDTCVSHGNLNGFFGVRRTNGQQSSGGPIVGDSSTFVTVAIRWTGKITVPRSGEYGWQLSHDDGARLYINGALVLDKWGGLGQEETDHTVHYNAGDILDFVVELVNSGGQDMNVDLAWGRGDVPDTILTGFMGIPGAYFSGPVVATRS